MSLGWLIALAYVYGVVESLHVTLASLARISSVTAIVAAVLFLVVTFFVNVVLESDEDGERVRNSWKNVGSGRLIKAIKIGLVSFLVATTLNTLIPDREGMKYIAGAAVVAYSAEAVSNIDGIDKLPANVVSVVNKLLEDIARDLDVDTKSVTKGAVKAASE